MTTKKITLRDFQIKDISIAESIFNSDIRQSVIGNYKQLNLNIIKRDLLSRKNSIQTIVFDNQRVGLILKNKKKFKILLRYRYMKLINYKNIYKLLERH